MPSTPRPSTTGAKRNRADEDETNNLIYPETHRLFSKPTGPWQHPHHQSTENQTAKQGKQRQSMRKKTVPAIGRVPGVTADDLPVTGDFSNPIIRNYEALPVVRPLEWRTEPDGNMMRKGLRSLAARKAAFVQTRGEEASEPCAPCKAQKGIWKTCVIGLAAAEKRFDRSCANCRFARRATCECKTTANGIRNFIDAEPETSGQSSYAELSPSPTSRTPSSQGDDEMSLDPDEDVNTLPELGPVLRQKRVRRTSSYALEAAGNWAKFLDAEKEQKQILSKTSEIKQESPALPTPRKSIRSNANLAAPSLHPHEGEVIPFPLDREAFNNVSLLKRAKEDMLRHLNRVDKRIQQLEGTGNPWDLI